jgi:hypothetical protein
LQKKEKLIESLSSSRIAYQHACHAFLVNIVNLGIPLIQKESDDAPGKCVSIDTLVLAQLGLVPQMSGFLTNLQIWGATVFFAPFSDYVYVAFMRDLGLDETLLAKTAFERHASKGGVTIHSYQADNGRFADSGFQQAIKEASQTITFCAVGAHHQNGIVEQ